MGGAGPETLRRIREGHRLQLSSAAEFGEGFGEESRMGGAAFTASMAGIRYAGLGSGISQLGVLEILTGKREVSSIDDGLLGFQNLAW